MATTSTRATRTDPEIRKRQLVEAAMPAFAERGYDAVELKEIAAEVGVTPNLIHHYFPGGKQELHLEAVRLACDEIVAIHDSDPTADLETKLPANTSAYLSEALAPTPRYVLFMRATRSPQADVAQVGAEARDRIISGIALNNLGTTEPPPQVRAALVGLIGFLEASAAQWRELGIDDRQTLELLLMNVTRAAATAAGEGEARDR
ncbi:MAG: TetR family transcriptional regulator [Solirubrobacteraceae bacterium]|nr:TetR family transcriptional regulator [Solirubrobacteraceae bacterium]